MSQNTRLRKLLRDWAYRIRRPETPRSQPKARLQLETIESRIAPAQLPAPTITDPRAIVAGFSPQAAHDPLNPDRIVVVSTAKVSAANENTTLNAYFSSDAGQSWSAIIDGNFVPPSFSVGPFGDDLSIFDPVTITPTAYPNNWTADVAWSRDGFVYIVNTQTDLAKNSGALVVHSFDMTGGTPRHRDLDIVTGFPVPDGTKGNFPLSDGYGSVIYRWAAGQDPAFNPAIGLDNNVPTFTDPQTGQVTHVDTMVNAVTGAPKGIYVAWGTKFTAPSANTTPTGKVFNPNQIFAAGSGDKGVSFSGPVMVTNAGHFVSAATLPFVAAGSPEVAMSPNGRLVFAWHDITKYDEAIGNVPDVHYDFSQPDNEMAADPAVAAKELWGAGGTIPQATDPGNGNPHIEGKLVKTITITNSDLPASFVTLADLNATIAAFSGAMTQTRVTLSVVDSKGATRGPITLVQNRLLSNGNSLGNNIFNLPPGLEQADKLGIYGDPATGPYAAIGTVFDDLAPRYIWDTPNEESRGQHYRPENANFPTGQLAVFNGMTRAQLVGSTWTLTVTDSRSDTPPQPPQFVEFWSLRFSSGISTSKFGGDQAVPRTIANPGGSVGDDFIALPGAVDVIAPDLSTASPTHGPGPGITIAFDQSVGGFSKFSNRMYIGNVGALKTPGTAPGFNINNTDIFLVYSDDYDNLAPSWSDPFQINDDSITDNFTEGTRVQFSPTITTDPVTGAVVAMWYDARVDASNTRMTTFISTSLDGGETWSKQGNHDGSFLNEPKRARDAITLERYTLEPVPTNMVALGTNGLGQRQTLLAYGGRISPYFSGNPNNVYDAATPVAILTADVRTSTGPRVLLTDMGAVTAAATVGTGGAQIVYNGSFAADGTRMIDGFTVVFDREIDASTFTPADVNVLFRSPTSPLSDPGTAVPVGAIELVDMVTYFVRFATPQSAVGTYIYSVGPMIADRQRDHLATPTTAGAATEVKSSGVPVNIDNLVTVSSSLTFPGFAAGQTIGDVEVKLKITHPNVGDLRISLVAPDGTRVMVMNNRGGTRNNIDTLFNDTTHTRYYGPVIDQFGNIFSNAEISQTPRIDIGTIGNTGGALVSTKLPEIVIIGGNAVTQLVEVGFRPDQLLSAFIGHDAAGTWTLEIEDSDAITIPNGANPPLPTIGTLDSWSVTITPVAESSLFRPLEVNPFLMPPTSNTANPPFNAPQASIEVPVDIIDPLPEDPPEPFVPITVKSRLDITTPLPVGTVLSRIRVNLDIEHTRSSDLLVSLVHPDGTRVQLIGFANVPSQPDTPVFSQPPENKFLGYLLYEQADFFFGRGFEGDPDDRPGFRNTTLDGLFEGTATESKIDQISAGEVTNAVSSTFTGVFRPEEGFEILHNKPIEGSWTLEITDFLEDPLADGSPSTGVLNNWSITLMPGQALPEAGLNLGNLMDQDADATPWEPQNDAFATPSSDLGLPFRLPYSIETQPLIVPGPRIVGNFIPGQRARIDVEAGTIGTIDYNGVVPILDVNVPQNTLEVTFDRLVDPFSFQADGRDIQRIAGPAGDVAGPFLVKPIYPANTVPEPGTPTKVFRITLPVPLENVVPSQLIYSVTLGPDIQAADALALNVTSNSVIVDFDRLIDPTTFTPADILKLTGPISQIAGPFTITPLYPEATTAPPAGTPTRRFSIGFPTQELSGQYVFELSANIATPTGELLDTNSNAGLALVTGTSPDPVTAAIENRVFQTPIGPGVAISPGATVSLPLPVADDFVITQLILGPDGNVLPRVDTKLIQVRLNILHPNTPDLIGDLVAPDGTRIRLFTQVGTVGQPPRANFTNTLFDDYDDPTDGTDDTPIQLGAPPFDAGPYRPQLPLSALIGRGSLGTWRLEIRNVGSVPGQLVNWTLTLPRAIPGTGLGETLADRATVGFRIFTQDPANELTQQVWTPVGPASAAAVDVLTGGENLRSNAGRVTAITIDPTDPSGNTVFAAGASGGVWKTSNFLTRDPGGPIWVPLTDFGPTTSLNIADIEVFSRNGDPNQTIVFAVTGEGNFGGVPASTPGVGLLRSMDGGRTWEVFDSTVNADLNTGITLPIDDAGRDHLFSAPTGATGYKIVIDPTLQPNNELLLYLAMDGTAAQQGIWRSANTGRSWTRIRAGRATDVLLAETSIGSNGNRELLYAAFAGEGVFFTPQATSTTDMTLLSGTPPGNALIRDMAAFHPVNNPTGDEVLVNQSTFPNGAKGLIKLAVPAVTNSPLLNTFYSAWMYAAVATPTGAFDGLYVTRDFGRNWTRADISFITSAAGTFGTNDESKADIDPASYTTLRRVTGQQGGTGNRALSVVVDPLNPFIVYVGGESAIRVDTTMMNVPQTYVFNDNSAPNTPHSTGSGGGVGFINRNPFLPPGVVEQPNGLAQGAVYLDPNGAPEDYLNLQRDPLNPFLSPSTIQVFNSLVFSNDGRNVEWQPLNSFLFGARDVYEMLPMIDPLTRKVRLIFGTAQGIYSAVDDGTGNPYQNLGFTDVVDGSRNGNLQIHQFYSGAVQPSQLAADIAGALFYGMSQDNGFPVSAGNIFGTGNIDWTSGRLDPGTGVPPPSHGIGIGVVTDALGTGTAYQYRLSASFDPANPFPGQVPTDFFRFFAPNADMDGSGTSRTFGLVQPGEDPGMDIGRWPLNNTEVGHFGVNPFFRQGITIGALNGSVYRTTNQGVNWFEIATPAITGGTIPRATAYGAPTPVLPGVPDTVNLLNNFIYVGTTGGRVFVTYTGAFTGTPGPTTWREISTGIRPNSKIMQIVPNTRRGSNDAYLVTEDGVYFLDDAKGAAPSWVEVTGDLFTLTRPFFPDPNDPDSAEVLPALTPRGLRTIVADWRYAIPVTPGDPQSATFPVLFVGGEGGVFRSKDQGQSWTFFPDVNSDDAPIDGGWLPNTTVTDLDLSVGDLDPVTGLPLRTPDRFAGLNMLVATTYGRGTFAIRLGDQVPEFNIVFQKGPKVTALLNPNPDGGPSDRLWVDFNTAVEPTSFDPGDVELRDTNGNLIPVTQINLISVAPAPGVPNPRTRYEIVFPTQTVQGFYSLIIKPTLADIAGNLMNQDQDNLNGEPIQDRFVASPFLNGDTRSLVITPLPSPIVAGTQQAFTVTILDGFNNIVTGFNGTVSFSSTDPQAVLPPDYTFVPGTDNGVHTFTVEFRTAGPQSITITPTNTTINPGTANTVVVAAAANRLSITGLPATMVAGTTVGYTLTAFDPFGNIATGFTGVVTTTVDDPQGTVTSPYTFTAADAGVRAYTTNLRTAGLRTITATSPTLASSSAQTTVIAANGVRFALTNLPATATAGVGVTFLVTVFDTFGNVATGYTGPVQFVTTDPQGTAPNAYTYLASDNGQKSFTVIFRTVGSRSVTASHPTNALTPASGTTIVNPNTAFTFTVTVDPLSIIEGGTVTVTVTAFDQFGNRATGYNGPVRVTTTDSNAGLPANATLTNGVGTFQIVFRTPGQQSVTVADPNNAAVNGTVGGIEVIALRIAALTIAAAPTTVPIGGQVTVTVRAFDQFGNPAIGRSGPVTLQTTDGQATVPVNTQLTNGVGTFVLTYRTPNTHTVTATDPNSGSTASVGGIIVLPPPPIDLPRAFAAGADASPLNRVRVYNFDGTRRSDIQPFDPGFFGGVRPALARTPDGSLRVVATPGPNWFGEMRVFDATTGVQIQAFPAFPGGEVFTGGMYVSAGDFNNDGYDDYVLSPDQGGGPRVRIVDGKDPRITLADFFGIEDIDFRGGARTAVGDVNGDGVLDLAVAAGFSGGPRIAIFDGRGILGSSAPPKLVADFFVFEQTLRNGVYITLGDLNGDGKAEVVAGGGPGGGPRVFVLDGAGVLAGNTTTPIANFFAGNTDNRGGIRVSVANMDDDNKADLIVGAGTGGGSRVSVFAGKNFGPNPTPPELFAIDDPFAFPNGVFVG